MKSLLLFLVLGFGSVLSLEIVMSPDCSMYAPSEQLWNDWKQSHNVEFEGSNDNENLRLRMFLENIYRINTHNSQPNKTFCMSLNQFSSLDQTEVRTMDAELPYHFRDSRDSSNDVEMVYPYELHNDFVERESPTYSRCLSSQLDFSVSSMTDLTSTTVSSSCKEEDCVDKSGNRYRVL